MSSSPPEGPDAQDVRWMEVALAEARKGVGMTSPNPPVGAVVVGDGELLGLGHHRKAGAPHAEIEAMAAVTQTHPDGSRALRGATLYVTLEPCSTQGRTPPCCEAIMSAGIGRVVYAAVDPHPEHAGRADAILAGAGIEVVSGVLAEPAGVLIRPFAKRVTTGLPWVIAKAGMSWDGRITRPAGEPQWLTSEAARADVHRLRGEVDAIVVGAETVRKDNPALTVRGSAHRSEKPQPFRVVLTRSGNLPVESTVLRDEFRSRTLVMKGRPLVEVLQDLAERGCNAVLVEGGGETMGAFLAERLVDELIVYYAPLWCGGGTRPASGPVELDRSIRLADVDFLRFGDNIRLRGLVMPADPPTAA